MSCLKAALRHQGRNGARGRSLKLRWVSLEAFWTTTSSYRSLQRTNTVIACINSFSEVSLRFVHVLVLVFQSSLAGDIWLKGMETVAAASN